VTAPRTAPEPIADLAVRKRAQTLHEAIQAKQKQSRQRKARFDTAHVKGMKALKEHNYADLEEAIQQEADIIAEARRTTERLTASPPPVDKSVRKGIKKKRAKGKAR
jgi:hypothetical protein